MAKVLKIGVLAYHGDVVEHVEASKQALKNLKISGDVIYVRTKKDLENLDALLIPGGESTVLHKLAEREGIFEEIKKIKNIFGTCAGTIMLAKNIQHKAESQKSLELMDITVDRNAYGRQTDSFEKIIDSKIGKINAIFIRAPKITKIGKNVAILAKDDNEILACEEHQDNNFYLACCFHPELITTKFHEYFFTNVVK